MSNRRYPAYANGAELAAALETIGFTLTKTGGGHYKATHPNHRDKPPVRFAATPSDRRWALNTLSWIRRTYGIDLKQ